MSTRLIPILLGSFLFASSAFGYSPMPKLTTAGAIAALKADPAASRPYRETFNLGATGLRGWIYIDSANAGQQGLMTNDSREILVTAAAAPGNAVFAVDDVILGVLAGSSGTVPEFSRDCRKEFGVAIGEAEKLGQGNLRVIRWRAGITSEVDITMAIMKNYSATAPFACPKSELVFEQARDKLISDTPNLYGSYNSAIDALALLASVPSSNTVVQTRLRNYARSLAPTNLTLTYFDTWSYGYIGLFLSEYYLKSVAEGTPDASVLHGINEYAMIMAKAQSRYGTYGQGAFALKPDGSLHGTVAPYGTMSAAGIPVNAALVLAKKALLVGGRPIDPEINDAIKRGSDFYSFYVNKGPIPYGEHEPYIDENSSGHAPNGKDAMCAVMFGLQENRQVQAKYFARMTTAGFTGREYGHTGQGFSFLWGALGANVGGDLAVIEYLKNLRWHFDLLRRTDGSFTYEGQDEYGGGNTIGDPYLGTTGYNGMNPTATYVLSYAVSLKKLYITGKKDPGAADYKLTQEEVEHAISAATYKLDCPLFSNAKLTKDLGDYDPVVRNDAAKALAKRPMATEDVNALIAQISNGTLSPDANKRMGICQTLGVRNAAGALPALRQRLSDDDTWVRAQAGKALGKFGGTANTELVGMLTAYANNATDPEQIVWDDPVQISNGYLSFVLFNSGMEPDKLSFFTKSAPKTLLYPAIRKGLTQPDSNPRSGVAGFVKTVFTLEDAKALTPELLTVVTSTAQADSMWHAGPRAKGIETLSDFRAAETIPLALALQTPPLGFDWGCSEYRLAGLRALATYGDSARWTLPTLRDYQVAWRGASEVEPTLASTIAKIESAITTPPGIINLKAVANSQLIVINASAAKSLTLSGSSIRGTALTYLIGVAPTHGTLSGTVPNLVYTPLGGYTGPDHFTFRVSDSLTTSEPATVSVILGTAGTGLKGEYFDEMNFTVPRLSRNSAVNFDWAAGSPDASISPDTFSVRWSGQMLVPETATYRFSTLSSEGLRLYINGVPVIDSFSDQSTAWRDSIAVNLTAGQLVDIHLNYYENTGLAVAKLKWTGPSFAGRNGSFIGQEWLFSGATATPRTPFAHAESLKMIQNISLPITLSGSGLDPRYSIVGSPENGQLSGTPPNLIYTPTLNFSGVDSFTFKVTNGALVSAVATVSVNVMQVNFAPVAKSQNITAAGGTTKPVVLSGSDVDGDALTYRVTAGPIKGNLSGTLPNIGYTPNVGATGTDSINFVVNDGLLDSAIATVAVTVTAANTAPVALEQNITTAQGVAKLVTLSATDANSGTLTYATVTSPMHGLLSGTPPSVTYTPASGYYGVDSFTFKANDGLVDSPPARVNITVTSAVVANSWTNPAGGVWSLASNWTAAPASSAATLLEFNVAGTYNAASDVPAGFMVNQLSFGGSTATLSGNSILLKPNGGVPAQIIQKSSSAITIATPLDFPTALEMSGSGTGAVALTGKVTGAGGMVKTSTSAVRLSGLGSSINGLTKVLSGNLSQSGGSVASGGLVVDGGSMSITGNATRWTPSFGSSGVTVGKTTGGNLLSVTGGAQLLPYYDRVAAIGDAAGSNTNLIIVSGSGSKFGDVYNATALHLGSSWTGSEVSAATGGNDNEIRVLAGGSLTSGSARINRTVIGTNSSGNKVTIDGAGSEWNICPGSFFIGYGGAADVNNGLVISNGGQVNMRNKRWVVDKNLFYDLKPLFTNIGNANQASENYVTVTGAGSLWNLETGQINIGNGGLSNSEGGSISGINNLLTVTDGGIVKNLDWLMVGNSTAAANNNSVLIREGGKLELNGDGGIYVGSATSTGNRINVTAGGILQFKSILPRINIGSGTGNRVTFKNGTLSYNDVTGADMSANKTAGIGVGEFIWVGQNTYRLVNSTDTSETPYIFANDRGPTTYTALELLGNTAITRNITLDGSHGGSLYLADATATLSGGISLAGPVPLTATASTSTLSGRISGGGGLVKLGSAKLTLSNAPSYSGDTTVVAGTLKFSQVNLSNQDSTVTLPTSGAALELGFSGTDTVARLVIGGNLMPVGIYKSATNTGSGTAIPQILGNGTLTVLSQVPVPSYQSWAVAAAQGLTAGMNDGIMADPDQDGVSNLLEFSLGGSPMISSATILPVLTKTVGAWALRFNRSDVSLAAGARQFIEYSENMRDWTSVEIPTNGAGNVEIIPGIPSDAVKVMLPTNGVRAFVRLKVSR